MIKREVWYFRGVGPQNTPACLDLMERAVAEGFRHLVMASTTGDSGVQAVRRLAGKDANLVVVGHSVGFKDPNLDEFREEHYQEITRLGGKVLKATILTHSLETSLADQFKGSAPTLLIANTLRRLGQGIKVCCEIVMEAVDAASSRKGKRWWPPAAPPGAGTPWPSSRAPRPNASCSSRSWRSGASPGCEAGKAFRGPRRPPGHRAWRSPPDPDRLVSAAIKGGVCGGDNLFGREPVVRKDGQPQRDGSGFEQLILVFHLEIVHRQAQFFRPLLNCRQRGSRQDQQKFLPAIPAGNIFGSNAGGDHVGHGAQECVPAASPKLSLKSLKWSSSTTRYPQLSFLAPGPIDFPVHGLFQITPVV